LIELFQAAGYEVGILGDRLGAYFTESAPAGVVDLINIEDVGRLRVQMEFLKKSNLAVGAMSGATLFSLATGTPTLIFGYAEEKSRYESENFLKTPLLYHSHMNPTPKELFELATNFLKNTIPVQLRV
jgi:ADP-heptose:LPS heptosyltransferase